MQPQSAVAANPFTRTQALFDGLCRRMQGAEAFAMTHSDLERTVQHDGRALLRQLLQDHLDLRGLHEQAAPHPFVVGNDGIERPHHREAVRQLRTLVGDVVVPRLGYGQRGAQSRWPMDAALNLPRDPYSLGIRYVVGLTVARSAYEEGIAHIESTTGTHIPKRQAEHLAREAAQDFDAFYAERVTPTGTALSSLLILSCDGKGVVVRKEDLRPATRKKAEQRVPRLKTRLTRGEKKHAKRMSTVAAIYTVCPHVRSAADIIDELCHNVPEPRPRRPKPEHKRVWACLRKEPTDVIRDLFDEAERRDPEHRKTWVVIVDGNETQLALAQAEAKRRGVQVLVVLDFIHVLQYLWKASTAFYSEKAPEREVWVLDQLEQVLRGKATDVAAGIRRSATLHDLGQQARLPVDDCADYLLKYQAHLRYDQYLRDGLPIASGVIEGACRHLVADRMDKSGAHWSLLGAEAVLQLRALVSSGDFDAYWAFHERREYQRNHAVRYRGEVPSPNVPASSPRLRLAA